MHASDGRRVAVQRVYALPRVSVPHFERPIRGAADDNVVKHLRGPDSARVSHQRSQTLCATTSTISIKCRNTLGLFTYAHTKESRVFMNGKNAHLSREGRPDFECVVI